MNEDPIKKRLDEKFKDQPKWAEDFSIETSQDKNVSRRDFIRFMALVSFGLFAGTLGIFLRYLWGDQKKSLDASVKIAGADEMAIGDSKSFMIPGKKEPGIMVRLDQNRYVAYGQKCTHLQCPVLWNKDEHKLICPCHNGAFAAEDGRVLYGPPERPLPTLELEMKTDGIYYLGVKNGSMV